MKQYPVKVDFNACVGCGMCAKACAVQNIAVHDKKAYASAHCMKCGHCIAICPQGAISIGGHFAEPVDKTADIRLNPDDVLDVIRFRRSIRSFKSKELPKEVLMQILEAGRLTHTAKNLQDVSFAVLRQDKDRVEQLAVRLFKKIKPLADLFSSVARNNTISDHFFFFNAPLAIVIFAKDKTNGILAAQNMEFVAEAHGLGVLYSGFFTMAANASHKIKNALQIPKGSKVAMTLVLGYPNVKYLRSAPRKPLDVRYL